MFWSFEVSLLYLPKQKRIQNQFLCSSSLLIIFNLSHYDDDDDDNDDNGGKQNLIRHAASECRSADGASFGGNALGFSTLIKKSRSGGVCVYVFTSRERKTYTRIWRDKAYCIRPTNRESATEWRGQWILYGLWWGAWETGDMGRVGFSGPSPSMLCCRCRPAW